jgi:hypothetical protein
MLYALRQPTPGSRGEAPRPDAVNTSRSSDPVVPKDGTRREAAPVPNRVRLREVAVVRPLSREFFQEPIDDIPGQRISDELLDGARHPLALHARKP